MIISGQKMPAVFNRLFPVNHFFRENGIHAMEMRYLTAGAPEDRFIDVMDLPVGIPGKQIAGLP